MARWFYTDPLAAAWMAKHFGMGYEGDPGVPLEALTGQTFSSRDGWSRLYINSDSLHLLEPQQGDVVRTVDANCDHLEYRIFQAGHDTGIWREDWFKIIQRNGLAFHWPEVEP